MMVQVVNIANTPDFDYRHRKGDVYIGGAYKGYPQSIWANPFPVGRKTVVNGTPMYFTEEAAVERYIQYLKENVDVNVDGRTWSPKRADKDIFNLIQNAERLGCWCKPKICHGDYLKYLIDSKRPKPQPIGKVNGRNVIYKDPRYISIYGKNNKLIAKGIMTTHGNDPENYKYTKEGKLIINKTGGIKFNYDEFIGEGVASGLVNVSTPLGNKLYPAVYVFGDNDKRIGNYEDLFGSANRSELNKHVVGIRVSKNQNYGSEGAEYIDGYPDNDEEYRNNVKKIQEDIKHLWDVSNNKIIVFPADGIGTGISRLNVHAPRTFLYLTKILKDNFNITNGDPTAINRIFKQLDNFVPKAIDSPKSFFELNNRKPNTIDDKVYPLSLPEDRKRKRITKPKLKLKSKSTRKPIRKPIKKIIKKTPIKKCKCKK